MARAQSDIVDLKVRMREPLRAALEGAAADAGVSMNAEAVRRLERSFERQSLRHEVLGNEFGPELAGILLMVGATLRDLGPQAGFLSTMTLEGSQRWFDDPYAFDQAITASVRILEALRPKGDASPPPAASAYPVEMGAGFANSTIGAVATERGATQRLKAEGSEIANMLGPALVARLKEADDGTR